MLERGLVQDVVLEQEAVLEQEVGIRRSLIKPTYSHQQP